MELKDYKMSLYETIKHTDNTLTDLDNYIGMVQHGRNQDAVLSGRKEKQAGNIELYKKIKEASFVVTPTGVFNSGDKKIKENLTPNGVVCIDIDTDLTKEQEFKLYNDPYTFIIHKSFGGDGVCVFVRINKDKLDDAYNAVAKYYFDTYGIKSDMSCSNSNRLRFLSYDPDIHVNPKAKQFNVKVDKKDRLPSKQQTTYIFTTSDFDNILNQIRDRNIDLCDEDYYKYIRIGLSLASHFGESGRSNFHFICSYGSKYNEKDTDRDYSGFIKNGTKVSIGTFYYYCKEAGIELYSERTKNIINRVNISKLQGTPTVESVSENLSIISGQETTLEEKALIEQLINDKTDYSKNANSELTEIEQLANFIVDAYEPEYDEIINKKLIKGKIMDDTDVDDIYLNCKKNFDFNINKHDIRSILNSSYLKRKNILKDFIRNNEHLTTDGHINAYVDFIYPQSDYNRWAFTKWMVGTMHNWFCDHDDPEASPLTLVLTGKKHGSGKTSFCRHVLPKELSRYIIQSKLSDNKDAKFRLGQSLIVFDDEFGGKAFKDDKEYKELSNLTYITDRKSYGYEDTTLRRRASLMATTNEMDIIKDPTGNRRILPIRVDGTDYDAMVAMDKTPMIMEAYRLYKSGFDWRIYKEEEQQYIYENTTLNQAVNPIEELFFMYFSTEHSFAKPIEVIMNQGEVLQYLHVNSGMKPTKYDISEVFKKNNFEYKNWNGKKGVKLYMAGTNINPDNRSF